MDDPLQRVQLTKQLHLWQRRRGHRTGTDDVLCAWAGYTAHPHAKRVLDLGAGQGAVGLMLSGVLPDARLVAIEAQKVSYELLTRNIASNELRARFTAIHGDLRTAEPEGGPFELITGTPPFMPIGSGTPPKDPQREAARFELRGGVEAYCEAATRHLTPAGVLVLVMDAARPDRYERAFVETGLFVRHVTAVVPRDGQAPTYLIYRATSQSTEEPPTRDSLAVRDADGRWTPAFFDLRRDLDLPE